MSAAMKVKMFNAFWSVGAASIHVVKVDEHQTAENIWVNGSRRKRKGKYQSYFNSEEEARAWLKEQAECHKREIESLLNEAKKMCEFIENLKVFSNDVQ
jgi:ribosomal protein L13